MKIGLLAYHAVCNFGAMLQLLSTYMFLKNHGHEPVIINWVAKDLEDYYSQNTPKSQIENQLKSDELQVSIKRTYLEKFKTRLTPKQLLLIFKRPAAPGGQNRPGGGRPGGQGFPGGGFPGGGGSGFGGDF